MYCIFFQKKKTVGWFLLAGWILSGCGLVIHDMEGKPMSDNHLLLFEGAQHSYSGRFGVLKIGSGNYNFGDYVTDDAEKKHGWTVGLWLIIEGRPETEKTFTAYVGKYIEFEQYLIHVLRIEDRDSRGLYTEIEVSETG